MIMNHLIIPSILLVAPFFSLQAQSTDPLWLKAQAHIQGTNNFVAGEVTTHTEVFDGDGKNQDTIDKKTRLTGWKDGEPVRSVISLIETQKSGLGDVKFDLGLSNNPEKGLAEILTVQRQEETVLDSKPCFVFQITGKKKNKIPFTGKVWIEKSNGLPLRVDYIFDPSSIPMTKSMSYSALYSRSDQGHWLPKILSIDTTISIIFMKIRMTIRQDLDAWVIRP